MNPFQSRASFAEFDLKTGQIKKESAKSSLSVPMARHSFPQRIRTALYRKKRFIQLPKTDASEIISLLFLDFHTVSKNQKLFPLITSIKNPVKRLILLLTGFSIITMPRWLW